MDGKDNLEEKTREVTDIRMYHLGWNFLRLGVDIILTCLTTLRTYESVADHTMDGKDNLEEKTSEVVDIRNVLLRKNSCSFGFCSNEGGEGPCPIFFAPFHKYILVNRRSLFPPKCQ